MEKHPYFKRDAVEVTMAVEIEEVVVEDLKNEIEVIVEELPENYY